MIEKETELIKILFEGETRKWENLKTTMYVLPVETEQTPQMNYRNL